MTQSAFKKVGIIIFEDFIVVSTLANDIKLLK